MKKILSIILTIGLIMTNMTFVMTASAATVDAENYLYYTTIDMSAYYNVKQYLSSTTAGTISTDETLGKYDFFKASDTTTGNEIAPIALSKESMDSFITDGIATFDGVPFKVSTPDNAKGAFAGGSITLPKGYYKEIKFLTVHAPQNIGDNSFYLSVKNSANESVYATHDYGEKLAEIDYAKVYADSVIPQDTEGNEKKSTVTVVTSKIPETRIGDSASFYLTLKENGNRRVIGVTLVGLQGDEYAPIIANKIKSLPEVSEITEDNFAQIAEISELIETAEITGADLAAIEGMDKFKKILEYKEAMDNLYTSLDLKALGKLNAKLFLSSSTAGTITETQTYPDFLMANIGDKSTPATAMSKEGIDKIAPNGKVTYDNVPYIINTEDNADNAYHANGYITVPTGYYKEVRFLYLYPNSLIIGNNNLHPTYKNEEGTSAKLTKVSTKYKASVAYAKVYADTTIPSASGVNINEGVYSIPDITKKVSAVSISPEASPASQSTNRVLAITLVGLQGDEYAPIIANKIESLPDVSEITEDNFAEIAEISDLIKTAEITGADLTAIEGMDKFNEILAQRDEILTGERLCKETFADKDIEINVTFDTEVTAEDINKENIVLTCDNSEIDYTLTAVTTDDAVTGVRINLKNEITTGESYQLKIAIGETVCFEKSFTIPKPVTVENLLMKNSSGEIIDSVSDVTDGKLTVTATINNNTFETTKRVKLIAVVYNGKRLANVQVTDAAITKGTAYDLSTEITIPTDGLTDAWKASLFVWEDDMITPLNQKITIPME